MLTLGELVRSYFVALPAGAVEATGVVGTELLTAPVCEVPAFIHIFQQRATAQSNI